MSADTRTALESHTAQRHARPGVLLAARRPTLRERLRRGLPAHTPAGLIPRLA